MNNHSQNSQDFSGKLIYGFHSVIEHIKSGHEFEKVYLRKGTISEHLRELLRLLKERNIPYQWVPVEKLNRLTRKNHQGVVGIGSLIEYQALYPIVAGLFEKGKDPFFVALDGITDVRNMGAIARTAECAGVDGLLLPAKESAQINPDAIKTSSGALSTIPVCRTHDLVKELKFLKESGLKIIVASEKAERLHYEVAGKGPLVLVIGSEGQGVSQKVLQMADDQFRIPVYGQVRSLNASNAAAIIMYEIRRQRDASN